MSEYYNETTKKVGSWSDIVSANPNTSFPSTPSEDIAKSFGWELLHQGEIPAITSDLKILVQDGIEKNDQNQWVKKWLVADRHKAYKDGDGKTVTKKSQDDAWNKVKSDAIASENRSRRNRTLEKTDHYGLSDVTMSDKVKTYRQALRDLPTHKNWPDLKEEDWPTLS